MADRSKVILVTGAGRGLGRGMARAFGRGGATVYVTSRPSSVDAAQAAADEVREAGGQGIAVAVDHGDVAQVKALMAQIRSEQGRLDILVNNAASVHPELSWPGAFWDKPIELAEMFDVPLRAAYITACHAAPLMIEQGSGLIANISFYGAVTYFHGPAYGAVKAGTDKMSSDMAIDLRPHGVACVSIWPGFIYSDAVAQYVATTPPDQMPPGLAAQFSAFERPEFTGLVIAALHADPALMEHSGKALIGAELGTRYGIKDIDGKQPQSYRETMGSPLAFHMPAPAGD